MLTMTFFTWLLAATPSPTGAAVAADLGLQPLENNRVALSLCFKGSGQQVRFRLKIDKHDYETKRKRAEGFLQAGDKVKAMILFRGREQSRPEQGVRLLQRFAEDVAEFGTVESTPTIDGRNMVMVIGPHKNKAEAKAEAQAKKAETKARTQSGAQSEAQEVAAPTTAGEKNA